LVIGMLALQSLTPGGGDNALNTHRALCCVPSSE
jgi:hypothetical protein